MASEPGGVASKLGGLYERQYAAEQLLRVARGRRRRLRWEIVTTEPGGADIEVERVDGVAEFIQLKRQNGSKDKWTIADLDAETVLLAAANWLDDSPDRAFTFVSSVAAPQIKDICDQAQRYDGDAVMFFKDRVGAAEGRKLACKDLFARWGLRSDDSHDADKALSRLKRMEFTVRGRGRDEEERLLNEAELTFTGTPSDVIARLAAFLEQRLTQNVHADEVIAYMADKGSRLRELAGDPLLPKAIEQLTDEFQAAIAERLTGGVLLERPDVAEIAGQIRSITPPRVVIVHGGAGSGKSAVLLGLCRELSGTTPMLPLSLTSHPPESDLFDYGRSLGLNVTPGVALRAIAGDRRPVLIIDQLDALRYTSPQSAVMWQRGHEILRRALDDGQIVIVACRSFDLESDPNIRRWKDQAKIVHGAAVIEVKIGDLAPSQVESLLKDKGADYKALSPRLQKLLCHPITLDHWLRLAARGQTKLDLVNETELLSDLIKALRQEAVRNHNVLDADVSGLVDAVRAYMEEHGAPSIPAARLDGRDTALGAACAVGLLVKDGKAIRFPHQSYFDHLVAKHVYLQAGGSPAGVLTWLKQDQSLARREQLRQLLIMLRDESAANATKIVEAILLDGGIRFHLKQVVFGVLRSAEQVSRPDAELILRLAPEPQWQEHIWMRLLWASANWFDALNDLGLWARCLKEGRPYTRDQTLGMLSSVVVARPRQVDDLLRPLLNGSITAEDMEKAAPFDPSDDSPLIAEYREQAVRSGKWVVRDVYLDRVAAKAPDRAVRLLDAMLRRYLHRRLARLADEGSVESIRSDFLERHIRAAVRKEGPAAWPELIQLVRALQRLLRNYYRQTRSGNSDYYDLASMARDIAELVVDLAGEALAGVAEQQPVSFKQIVDAWSDAEGTLVGATILIGLARGPAADAAIAWVAANKQQLPTRIGLERDHHSLALDVIRRHAGTCSHEALAALERSLLSYTAAEEKKSYEHLLGFFRDGQWWYMSGGQRHARFNPCGRAQHLLLGAIPASRRGTAAAERVELWDRKFGGPAVERKTIIELSRIGSPIPEDRASAVSDKHWRVIVARNWRMWQDKQTAEERKEYSHQAISGVFETAAKKEPARFVRLAKRFPAGADAAYFARLWSVLADNATDISGIELSDLHALLDRTADDGDGYALRQACWFLRKHPELEWGEPAWRVFDLASQDEDPKGSEISVHTIRGSRSEADLESTGINCVRGVAATCLSGVLQSRPDRLPRSQAAVDRLVVDPHVAVRMEAAALVSASASIDVELGLPLLRTLTDFPDERLLAGRHLNHALLWARWSYPDKLGDLFRRMVTSTVPSVSRKGARWVGAEYFQFGRQPELYRECLGGSVEQRVGIAEILHQLVDDDKSDRSVVQAALVPLFDDPEERVQQAAAQAFRDEELIKVEGMPELATKLVGSQAFLSGAERFLWALDEYCVDVFQYREPILLAAQRFAGDLSGASRDYSRRLAITGRELASLLLRLYDLALKQGDPQLAGRCLDAWDLMIQHRVGDIEGRLETYSA